MAYGHKTAHHSRMRAHIVLHAALGRSNARIAREAGLHVDTVRTWRGRFVQEGMAEPVDRRRPGRPPSFTALQAAQVKAPACQLPAETGVPLSRWSCPELVREAVQRDIASSVSASTVRRWLAQDALKPWQHRSWIFITDPDFGPKATRRAGPLRPHLARPAARTGRARPSIGGGVAALQKEGSSMPPALTVPSSLLAVWEKLNGRFTQRRSGRSPPACALIAQTGRRTMTSMLTASGQGQLRPHDRAHLAPLRRRTQPNHRPGHSI